MTERNAHVAPLLRDVLNAFSNTQPLIERSRIDPERLAEIDRERLAEWREEDREREQIERGGRACA